MERTFARIPRTLHLLHSRQRCESMLLRGVWRLALQGPAWRPPSCPALAPAAAASRVAARWRSADAWQRPAAAAAAADKPPSARRGAKRRSSAAEPAAAASAASADLFGNRQVLADKLTATAKQIEWTDPPGDRPTESTREEVDALQARLGYRFTNRYLLRLALIHSSAAPTTHNAILAWLGDAALYLIVAEEVSAALGYVPIGKLSEVRKTLIGRAMCERYARHLGLETYLVTGKCVLVQAKGQPSANMLAEMFEAVMGAIYLDGGLDAVRRCYLSHFPLPSDPLRLIQPDGTAGPAPGAPTNDAWD